MVRDKYDFCIIMPEQAEEAAVLERTCFPPNEACTREDMLKRAELAPDLFIVAVDRQSGRMTGFITGIATNETAFRDEFFTDMSLHDKNGKNVMVLSLCVLPEYRKQGIARELMNSLAELAKNNGSKRLVLTCVDEKIKMYENMDYKYLGKSASVWGGHGWHEMERRV